MALGAAGNTRDAEHRVCLGELDMIMQAALIRTVLVTL